MVIYGLITQQSIGRLLIAGIIPGIIATFNFMVVVHIWAKLRPQDAPPFSGRWSWRENFLAVKGLWGVVLIAAIVIGGIYTGVFTPTEAGALAPSPRSVWQFWVGDSPGSRLAKRSARRRRQRS